MGLIDTARTSIRRITGSLPGFGVEMLLTAPTGQTLYVTGLHSKHHLGVDTEGNPVNTKNAHVSFHESYLTDASYPSRNAQDEISLINHSVRVKDSSGRDRTYKIRAQYPNETTGLIVCILGDLE